MKGLVVNGTEIDGRIVNVTVSDNRNKKYVYYKSILYHHYYNNIYIYIYMFPNLILFFLFLYII